MNMRILSRLSACILLLLILGACGPSEPAPGLPPATETSVTPAPAQNLPDYPPPTLPAPATPTLPAGYPLQPAILPTVDPYPGGLVWIIRPVGIQCEEGLAPGYGDLREATATVTAAGVRVKESQMTEMMVTAVCGSPTSAHYRLQIDASGLETAVALGWSAEN